MGAGPLSLAVALLLLWPLRAQDYTELFRQGLLALNGGDLAGARRHLESAAKLAAAEPRVWLALAQTYSKLGLKPEAEQAASKTVALGKDDPVIQRGLAIYHAENGDWERAAQFEAAYAAATGDREAAVRAVRLYIRAGRAELAVAAARQALDRENHAALRNALGAAHLAAGDPALAIAEYQEAIRLDPREETSYFDLAQLLMAHHNFDVAIQVLLAARRVIAGSGQLELSLAVAYYGHRRFPEAVETLLRAIDLVPNVPQPYVYLARILEHAGERLPDARQRFAAWAAANPQNPVAQYLYAKVLMAGLPAGAYPAEAVEAESLLRRAIGIKDGDWEPHFLLGTLLERKGELAAAARALERAIELNPENPAPHFPLARVLLALGRREEAQRHRTLFKELTLKQEEAIQERAASLRKFELRLK